jgi:hypothetical protein
MTLHRKLLALFSIAVVSSCYAQQWEIGIAGGYGFPRDLTVSNTLGQKADTGFKPGWAFSAVGGQNVGRHFTGEVRYTYRQSDLHVSSGGQQARFSGENHVVHYDLLVNATGRDATVRPYFAVGGGAKIYRGTGTETVFQPLSSLAVLSNTQQVEPVVSLGGGVKFHLGRSALMRFDFRDYASPFPNKVIAPNSITRTQFSGWVHDFVGLVGVSYTF